MTKKYRTVSRALQLFSLKHFSKCFLLLKMQCLGYLKLTDFVAS